MKEGNVKEYQKMDVEVQKLETKIQKPGCSDPEAVGIEIKIRKDKMFQLIREK